MFCGSFFGRCTRERERERENRMSMAELSSIGEEDLDSDDDISDEQDLWKPLQAEEEEEEEEEDHEGDEDEVVEVENNEQQDEEEQEQEDAEEGTIDPPHDVAEVRTQPYTLPNHYEWCTCDVNHEETMSEIYNLLKHNYVEDVESMFRFDYSMEFLKWALCPPCYCPDWYVGVRVERTKRIVAFITGVPSRIRIRGKTVEMAEINFLCIHKKLRSKRLTPLLIRELTRRVHIMDIWHAVYTTGIVLQTPPPFGMSQYWHRSLNPKKLVEIAFSCPRSTLKNAIKFYRLPDMPLTPGFRAMERSDVEAIQSLLRGYLAQFTVAPEFSKEDIEHWFMPTRDDDVIHTFVVEDPESGNVTDFCSFYILPSTILGNEKYKVLKAAYSFYNVSTKTPLCQLMKDALIVAKQKGIDVFNALDIMHNKDVFEDLKFKPGDGNLQYYLYNYRLKSRLLPKELGLLLL